MARPSWAVSGADFELAPDIYLRRIYWYTTDKIHMEVPCQGWQHGIIWFTDQKGHIFCPFTGVTHNLPQNHFYIMESSLPYATPVQMLTYMKKKWEERLSAIPSILVQLVAPEFTDILTGAPMPAPSSYYKPIKRNSKRGRFLELVLGGCVHLPSIGKALQMSRNNVLSYFYQMQKVNGIEYTLNKELDTVDLYMPEHEVWS